MNILQQVARRLERLEALDKVARPLAGAVGRAVRPRVVMRSFFPRVMPSPLTALRHRRDQRHGFETSSRTRRRGWYRARAGTILLVP
jgi:hypothetical protein